LKYLFDTNTVSALMRGNPLVISRLQESARTDVVIAQPVVAEIEFGLSLLPRGKRKNALTQRWNVLNDELLRIAWTDAVSLAFARVKAALHKQGQLVEDFDIAIAAHALAWDLCLVSKNTRHMARVKGLKLEDWTET
jgi:predicted nucleic acid-binding protein